MSDDLELRINVILDMSGLNRLAANFDGNVDKALESLATKTVALAQIAMDEPKTGRVVMTGKYKDRPHQTSAPGEAPAVDTGQLYASGYSKRIGRLAWEAGFSADYAIYLELGTRFMAARPFLFPAVQRSAGGIIVAMRPIFED